MLQIIYLVRWTFIQSLVYGWMSLEHAAAKIKLGPPFVTKHCIHLSAKRSC